MSYSISVDLNDVENVENVTVENLTDDYLIETDYFDNWFDDNVDLEDFQDTDEDDNYINLTDDELYQIKKDKVDDFKSSCEFDSIRDSYCSLSNSLDILQNNPSNKDIALVTDLCSNITIFYVEDLSVYGLSANGGGMCFDDLLALSYWIIDGYSPIDVRQVMCLSDKGEYLLNCCINSYKETKRNISTYDIQSFLRKYQG